VYFQHLFPEQNPCTQGNLESVPHRLEEGKGDL
jgi:hypothetical protein